MKFFLFSILVIGLGITNLKKYRNTLLSFFVFLWFIVFVLYELRFLPLYDIEEDTYSIYAFGILCFIVGYIVSDKLGDKATYLESKTYRQDNILNKKKYVFFVFLSIISLIVLSLRAIRAIPFWLSGGISELKTSIIVDHALSLGFFGDIVFAYIARPMHYVIAIYFVILIITKKRDLLIYTLSISVLILYFIASGSKFSILEYLVYFFAFIFYFWKQKHLSILRRKKQILFILCFVVGIFYIMVATGNSDLGDSIYCYLCGCIPHSNQVKSLFDGTSNFYGGITFNGILTIFNPMLSILGILTPLQHFGTYCFEFMMQMEETSYISPSIRYNAFVSMFIYFYADGGMPGVVILSLLFGVLFQKVYQNAIGRFTYRNASMLLLFTFFTFTSIVRSPFFLLPNIIAVIFIMFIIPNKKIQL